MIPSHYDEIRMIQYHVMLIFWRDASHCNVSAVSSHIGARVDPKPSFHGFSVLGNFTSMPHMHSMLKDTQFFHWPSHASGRSSFGVPVCLLNLSA